MADVIMPKMGDAMEEGVIVQWLKKVGDAVSAEEPIVEIETDKSNVEITADADGFVQSFAYQAGDTVPVGKTIAVIGAEANVSAAPAPKTMPAPEPAKPAPVAASAPAPTGKTNGTGPSKSADMPVSTPSQTPVSSPVASAVASYQTVAASSPLPQFDSFVGGLPVGLGGSASVIGDPVAFGKDANGTGSASANERVKATPLARAMALSNNVDLAALQGSGPDGAISKSDVEAALAGGNPAAAPQTPASAAPVAQTPAPQTASAPAAVAEGDEVQEYNGMRRTIAKRLAESKSTIPHFYVTSEIDMENMFALREQVNAGAGENQAKATVTDFLVKAVAVALSENPVVNSMFADNKRIVKKAINIGVAVSVDDGLFVPVVRNCESKSLRAIARETRPLIEKTRAGKLTPTDFSGGTFTISNLGQYDVENFAAIINPGEGAILAVSSIRTVPAVVNGEIVPRKRMKVTLCADHRVMDGVAGALFLQSLKRAIEIPLQMLA